MMSAYVRTQLLPYDFALTIDQEEELFAFVRSALEQTSDEDLFSAIVRFKVDELVDSKIRPWREQSELNGELNRLKEIRHAASGYVSDFLNGQCTPSAVEQLKLRFGIQDLDALDAELRSRIESWIGSVDDSELRQQDVLSVRDLVFTRLRSWC